MDSAVSALLADPATAQQTAEAFQRLKPVCSQLLYLRNDPQQLQQALSGLQAVLADVPLRGLPRCFDYVTYPLLFMVDSITATRTPAAVETGSSSSGMSVAVPAMSNDRAAEAVLDCLLVLLQRVGSSLESDQVLLLLQRLASVLQLTPEQAMEEVRLKTLKIIPALLPAHHHHQQQQQQASPPSPLSQPSTMPLTGLLVTQCLAAAAAEVSAGSSGSRAVRHAAVRALQAVVGAVGPGQQLSFLLPGLASGITKQLLAAVPASSGVPVTGAAAGSNTTVLLLQLLTQVINMTLGDEAIQHIPQQQQQQQGLIPDCSSSSVSSAAEALAMLEQLSLQATAGNSTQQQQQQQESDAQPANGARSYSTPAAEVNSPKQQQQQQQQAKASDDLTVDQDAEWLASSSSRVQHLLAMTLPRLLAHPQPAVRAAVAAAAAELLQHCSRALANSGQALLEVLLTLANDDYEQVSQVAVTYLHKSAATPDVGTQSKPGTGAETHVTGHTAAAAAGSLSKGSAAGRIAAAARLALAAQSAKQSSITSPPATSSSSSSSVLCELAVRLCCELPAAVRQGDAPGTAAAKRAAAALLCADVVLLHSIMFSKPHVIQQVINALTATFQLDPSTAALLLRATAAAPGGHIAASAATAGHGTPSTAHSSTSSTGMSQVAMTAASGQGVGYPMLPRMPLSLLYLISSDSYRAAAAVARALGRRARALDTAQQQKQLSTAMQGTSALHDVMSELISLLQTSAAPHKHSQQQQPSINISSSSSKRPSATPAAGEWQCQAAAVVIVVTEVMFGASAAWQAPISPLTSTAAGSSDGSSSSNGGDLQQHVDGMPVMDNGYESVLVSVLAAVTVPKLWGLPTSNAEMPVNTAAAAAGSGSAHQQLPAQVLGANALLLRVLIDCVGTAARCAGSNFTSSTRLLRAVLLPLLERLADPCPLVAAAAAGALNSICAHAGYNQGLCQLVGENADYIVDGVCKRLRNLAGHPRSPQLLAALLRQAGVGQQLLPLLAEPLRAALSGVSILARKQQPGYIWPFLHVLQSVAAGATQEAAASRKIFKAQLADIVARAAAAGLFHEEAGDAGQNGVVVEELEAEQVDGAQDAAGGGGGGKAANYFRQRLKQAGAQTADKHQQPPQPAGAEKAPVTSSKQETAGQSPATAVDIDLDQLPALPPGRKVGLSHTQVEGLELAWRRAYSAASLASAASEAATPLILQHNLRLAVLAVSVLSAALEALAAATDALDTEERMFKLLLDKPPDAALKPARPAPVKLLPAVHGIWPPLLACLQDTGSVALIEQGLGLMTQIMRLAGGRFMARRFKQEAWPLLVRLLRQGPQAGASALAAATAASSTGGGPAAAALLGVGAGPGSKNPTTSSNRDKLLGFGAGTLAAAGADSSSHGGVGVMQSALSRLGAAAAASNSTGWNAAQGSMVSSDGHLQETDGAMAPATLQRVQLAVLACLRDICATPSAAFAVLGHLIWDICMLAAPYLADKQPLPLREAAVKLLASAAQVDTDAVWLVLVDLSSCHHDVSHMISIPGHVMSISSEMQGAGAVQANGVKGNSGDQSASAATALTAAAASEAGQGGATEAGQGALAMLPQLQQLLPPVSGAAGPADNESGGLQKLMCSSDAPSCGRRAMALLQRVVKQENSIGWHVKAKQQLLQLRSAKGMS